MNWEEKYSTELKTFKPQIGEIIEKVHELPENRAVSHFLADIFIRLTRRFEKVFYGGTGNPLPDLEEGICWLEKELNTLRADFNDGQYREAVSCSDGPITITITSEDLSGEGGNGEALPVAGAGSFNVAPYDEATTFLQERIEKNGLTSAWFEGKSGLDAGCGGGRYAVAISQLGAGQLVALNPDRKPMMEAKEAAHHLEIKGLRFVQGGVLDLSFSNESFDFVLSNGVLHHTDNMEKGIDEIFRVLKKGGFLWLQLCGGNLYWRVNEIFRAMAKKIPYEVLKQRMVQLGFAENRIAKYLDKSHVPVCHDYERADIENLVRDKGFDVVQVMRRDVRTDRFIHENEQVALNIPFADLRWGEGLIKLLLKKSH